MTTPTPFFKVSGSGNDFLALVEPARVPTLEEIRAWCRRGVSIGADGLFTLHRDGEGIAMAYWNSDGRPANLCLNATRCAVEVVREIGWALNGSTTLRTAAGSFVGYPETGDNAAIEVARPETPRAIELVVPSLAFRAIRGWFVSVGVPHLVVPWEGSLASAPVVELGRPLRHHVDLGPDGANVNFVAYPQTSRDTRGNEFGLRTYERGVEDETLSCGTGIIAATAVGVALGHLALPVTAETQSGFRVEVDAGGSSWRLRGDARIVARGELLPAAAVEPRVPSWTVGQAPSTPKPSDFATVSN